MRYSPLCIDRQDPSEKIIHPVDGAVRELGFFSARAFAAAPVRITTAPSPSVRMDGGEGAPMFDHLPLFRSLSH